MERFAENTKFFAYAQAGAKKWEDFHKAAVAEEKECQKKGQPSSLISQEKREIEFYWSLPEWERTAYLILIFWGQILGNGFNCWVSNNNSHLSPLVIHSLGQVRGPASLFVAELLTAFQLDGADGDEQSIKFSDNCPVFIKEVENFFESLD